MIKKNQNQTAAEAEQMAGAGNDAGAGATQPGAAQAGGVQDAATANAAAQNNTQAAQQLAELTADLQRTRADFENYRKQMDLQKRQAAEYAEAGTVQKLLPLLDDIDRAIAATPELAPLSKSLAKAYKELGLAKVESAPGTEFNPDYHDAVMMEGGDGGKEVVAETLRSGYIYNGAVLRPAMVKVKTV